MKLNCWDMHDCQRGPGGNAVKRLGACPAATDAKFHGIHGGDKAGRACWIVAGSMQPNQKAICHKVNAKHGCLSCAFYKLVQMDESQTERGFSATLLGMRNQLIAIEQHTAVFGESSDKTSVHPRRDSSKDIVSKLKQATLDILGKNAEHLAQKFDGAGSTPQSLLTAVDEVGVKTLLMYSKDKSKIIKSHLTAIINSNM